MSGHDDYVFNRKAGRCDDAVWSGRERIPNHKWDGVKLVGILVRFPFVVVNHAFARQCGEHRNHSRG